MDTAIQQNEIQDETELTDVLITAVAVEDSSIRVVRGRHIDSSKSHSKFPPVVKV
jgi:hypothetical protein